MYAGCCIRIVGVDEKADRSGAGKKLADQFEALAEQLSADVSRSRYIGARATEAGDKAYLDRVAAHVKNDWNRSGRFLGCESRIDGTRGDDHRHLASDQIGHKRRQSLILIVRPPVLNFDIPALDIPAFDKPAAERLHVLRAETG